jgi:hypothetical protein
MRGGYSVCLFPTTYCSLLRLIVPSGLNVSPRESSQRRKVEPWTRNVRKFCLNANLHVTFKDVLHAVKLRHGTDGFTSPPKEGVLRIFCPKNPTASARYEPASLDTKGHRSRWAIAYLLSYHRPSQVRLITTFKTWQSRVHFVA